jgi:hypothetical protein
LRGRSPKQSCQRYEFIANPRRRKEKLLFDAEDAGMTVYVCCRYENRKGEAGQWGPVSSVVIP